MTRKITKTFKNEEEVIASRKNDKWASNYGRIESDAKSRLNEGHYIECSRKHFLAPFGINFPATISFDTRD